MIMGVVVFYVTQVMGRIELYDRDTSGDHRDYPDTRRIHHYCPTDQETLR